VVPDVPVAGLALILGVDRFMSEARALTNFIGNSVATVVVAKWEGELDEAALARELHQRRPNPSSPRYRLKRQGGEGGTGRPSRCRVSRALATQACLSVSAILLQPVMSARVRPHPRQMSCSLSVHNRTHGLGQVGGEPGEDGTDDMRPA